MPPFDPIASPTVRTAPHREPAFVFPEQVEAARVKLAAFSARAGRKPNILVILFDDVGWGDFGCYGGGTAVGAPTPMIDALARRGLRNLYLDPKESRGYLTRKLAYLEVLREGMRVHLATFQAYPPKRLMGLRAPGPG